jgi:hypothetical protein
MTQIKRMTSRQALQMRLGYRQIRRNLAARMGVALLSAGKRETESGNRKG